MIQMNVESFFNMKTNQNLIGQSDKKLKRGSNEEFLGDAGGGPSAAQMNSAYCNLWSSILGSSDVYSGKKDEIDTDSAWNGILFDTHSKIAGIPVGEASVDDYEEEKVMKVILEEMKSRQVSSDEMRDKIMQLLPEEQKSRPTAFSSLQHWKVKANKIEGLASETSIIALWEQDFGVIAADTRVLRKIKGETVGVDDQRKKLYKVRNTVFMVGTGESQLIKRAKERLEEYNAWFLIQNAFNMNTLANIIAYMVNDGLLDMPRLSKEQTDFILVGSIGDSHGKFLIRMDSGCYVARQSPERIMMKGSGRNGMLEYHKKNHISGVGDLSKTEAVYYCFKSIEYVINVKKSEGTGGDIDIVMISDDFVDGVCYFTFGKKVDADGDAIVDEHGNWIYYLMEED